MRNEALRTAWDFVENTGRSIFLTGKAGTGKTTFLHTVVQKSRKRSIVVAPTGVAAINAGGVTIHSFFQLPFAPFVPNATIKNKFDFSAEKRRIIASLDLLIIDEISMVRSDLLDAIDSVLRRYRNRLMPFGGVQLLMIGDLQQLTPVVTPEDEVMLRPYYDTPYFFGSKALAQTDYVTIQLEKVYRQQDNAFIDILNHIRNGQVDDQDLASLNNRCQPHFIPKPEEGYIRLTTHNRFADHYNESELNRLTTTPYTYKAEINDNFPEYSYPTNETLTLKVGTQVMFVKNDPSPDHLYYNGRIGRVTYLDKNKIMVLCPGDNEAIDVMPLTWENARYTLNPETREIETDVQGTFVQYPLRLAWAITIHKSQGLTFDHAVIDATYSFAPGQVYVALSRCRTLEGLVLSSPIDRRAIINDTRVDDYIAHQEYNAQESIRRLPQLKEEYFRYLMLELFDFTTLLHQQEYMVRTFVEFLSRSYASLEMLQRQTLEEFRKQVIEVAAKWAGTISKTPTETIHSEAFLQRVARSADYFANTLDALLAKPLLLTAQVETGNKQVAQRLANILPEQYQTWKAKSLLLRKIEKEGFSITVYLKQKQLSLLDAMDDGGKKATKRGGTRKRKTNQTKEPKAPKVKSEEVTMALFRQGMKIEEIAAERGLAANTIFGHLLKYVQMGELEIGELIRPSHKQTIMDVAQKVGTTKGLKAIKDLCPEDVTYDEIRLVLAEMGKID